MGDLPETALGRATDAMKAAAAAAGGRWQVAWGDPGAFPSIAGPRVIWLGVADPVLTTAVHGTLVSELRARGLSCDERPFRAHLSLARVRSELTSERAGLLMAGLAELRPPAPASVESLVLYRSTHGAAASLYEELARTSL